MGIDLLDFTFRVEQSFRVKVPREAYNLLPRREPFDITAGELHDWVIQICTDQGVPVPFSSWSRVKRILYDVTGKSPKAIRRETMIRRELGFS